VISFRGFGKRYGQQHAVYSLDLEVGRGEAIALLGPNGSGKTTCLKAAAGLIAPSAGAVLLGEPPLPAKEPEARRVLSFLPQRVLFPESLSGREVVEFYRSLRAVAKDRTEEVLRFSSLNGAGERAVGTYSGGMVQRLGLAVALLPDAPVLLLDEPTAALDPEGLGAFYRLVEQRRTQGKTILFTSHHLGDAERLADRLAVLVEGRLVACLTQRQLSERLSVRGVMRLRLGAGNDSVLGRVRTIAPGAQWQGDELVVPGPATERPLVLEAVRNAGREILGLSASEGRLDELYRELVEEGRGEEEH
jgi:Cu-processing system ATP-binding protein